MSNKHLKFEQKVTSLTDNALVAKSKKLLINKLERRSIRFFSDKAVFKEVIENILMIAASAPSGATNKQPWTFCAINNPKLKLIIRKAAEEEEHESYNGRMNKEWLEDLKKFDTDWQKPFLETAP
jgi:nitroreductase